MSRLAVLGVAVGVLLSVAVRVTHGDDDPERIAEARPHLIVQIGHTDILRAVAFSPDGRQVASGGVDRTALIWDVATGRVLHRLACPGWTIAALAFSPDGRCLLTASQDDLVVRLWDLATHEVFREFKGHDDGVGALAWSPGGGTLLTGAGMAHYFTDVIEGSRDSTARLWDAESGEPIAVLRGHTAQVHSVAYASDGRRVATGSADGTVRVWDVQTAREIQRFPGVRTAYSPNGRWLLTALERGPIVVRDGSTGAPVRELDLDGAMIARVGFSPDGRLVLAATYESTAYMWDAATGKEVQRLQGEPGFALAIAASPDGRSVLTGGGVDACAHLWSVSSGRETRTFDGRVAPVEALAVSDAGDTFLAGSTIWSTRTGQPMHALGGYAGSIHAAAISKDGTHLLTGGEDGAARIWDVASGEETAVFSKHESPIRAVALSPDGQQCLTGSSGFHGTVRLWALSDQHEIKQIAIDNGFPGPPCFPSVGSVAFSVDGTRVLTGNWNWAGEVFDLASGRRQHSFGGHVAAFSPDGRHVLAGTPWTNGSGPAAILDATTLEEQHALDGHAMFVTAVAFTPDGSRALTASRDATAAVWDVATGRRELTLDGHASDVTSIAAIHRGKWLLTSSIDGTSRVWDASSGRELCRLISFADGKWAVVMADGRFDASDLEEIEGMHWVMPDDPMRALSIETFMRDYYEPRLLPRLLAGEEMRPVKSLTAMNRAQPSVKVVSVEPDPQDEFAVRITVEVGSREHAFRSADGVVVKQSGVHDLRLFRDGQVVAWRDGGLDVGAEDKQVTIEGIRLPESAEETDVVFSAYAFNVDGVKSRTDRMSFRPKPAAEPRRGTAYVIAFGVDEFADPNWNLFYAAADAQLHTKHLTEALTKTEAWARVVPVLLTSTAEGNRARKEDLRAALADLAHKARPEDLVIIALSTHGLAEGDGGFHLLPSDAAFGENGDVLPDSCISTDDLKKWLRPVDAGEMVMIVDACQSAASVDQEGFKPGPMGSRGFGQLAWNKKMRILAASQASEYALESSQLRHGLLTHALVRDGLEAKKADAGETPDGTITLREWLAYGESRVPALAEAIATGDMDAVGPRGPLRTENRPEATRLVQRPSLFDFSREGRREAVLRRFEADGD